MGSPNKGPFQYLKGSLQLYTEMLNIIANSSPIIHKETFSSKSDFSKAICTMPLEIQNEARKFERRTGSTYKDFNYEVHENGIHVLKAIKPGDVPGSFAEYVKFLYKDGTIRAVYKDTTDNKGQKIHRHIKWPMREVENE